jgi:predicted PurR-regulated permease PerM
MNTTSTPPEEKEYPFYIKAPAVLLGLVLFVLILYVLADILVPLAFSVLIAILLNPLYVRLEKVMPKFFAIFLAILVAILVVVGLFYFLSTQINTFLTSLPKLKVKLDAFLLHAQGWAKSHFGLNLKKQVDAISTQMAGGGTMLTDTLSTIVGMVSVLVLIPIYVFMMLFYKPLILDFLFQVFSEKHSLRVAEVLSQTKAAVQSFMQGLMIETVIVCTLNSLALLWLGVPSAIVIGVIGGILNLLPYIGGLIAIALPVLMATISYEGYSKQLFIIIAYLVIQFIDNNILVPRIVSSKVQINALMSIIVVLLGGALWGVSGMFLSIPLIGVLKIIFDRIDELKPWGRLLGDEIPSEHIGLAWQKRWDRIFRTMQKKKELEEKAATDSETENNDSSVQS